MENEKRLVEIITELLIKVDEFVVRQKETNQKLSSVDARLGRVETEIVKLNLVSEGNTRVFLKLANEVENIAHLHERVSKLEKEVFK
ncbi:MAG: hypothetical protein JST43_04505 [Bacteroidetes bacterium]|nr:hypothetical protein [Bacteroidota bacterium]MBS1539916.1 hypothetical protein [Bacteroidota bacterium]